MLKLKVAADNGLPALFSTSRPGQANFGPEWASRKCSTGPNEVTANSATTIRYGAKAISASPLLTGPVLADPSPPVPEPADRDRSSRTATGDPDRRDRPGATSRDTPRRRRSRDGCHTRSNSTRANAPARRRDDVGDLVGEEVRAEELRDAEADAADQGGEPGLPDAAASVDHQHQDQRHEDRQDRGLPAHHGAEHVRVQPGDLAQGGDRDRDCAERDRGGVGDQSDRRGLDRG